VGRIPADTKFHDKVKICTLIKVIGDVGRYNQIVLLFNGLVYGSGAGFWQKNNIVIFKQGLFNDTAKDREMGKPRPEKPL
jgi:hypothetical protein